MENPLYHVLLEGQRVGPYDRRTIVGMRIKKALASKDVLLGPNGARLTVGELLKREAPDSGFQPSRTGSHSVVQALYTATLLHADGGAFALPAFEGPLEVRLQTRALRLAGRWREGRQWNDDRVKIALDDVLHTKVEGSRVHVALRPGMGAPIQVLTLDFRKADPAREFAQGMSHTTAWPESLPLPVMATPVRTRGAQHLVWGAVVGTGLVVAGLVVWVLAR